MSPTLSAVTVMLAVCVLTSSALPMPTRKRLGFVFGCSGWGAGCTHISSKVTSDAKVLPGKEKGFVEPFFTSGRSWSPSGKRAADLTDAEWNLLGKALEDYEGKSHKKRSDITEDEWNLLGSVLDDFEETDHKSNGKAGDFKVYWDKAITEKKSH
ncbi:uncharacterized protein LOC135502016 [Lineus longissimus]|uniref:uncharacterized protein LOC135502016 n=1 Tax=Lineus longissimus TaxID=88925 RepID=UPI002B4CB986